MWDTYLSGLMHITCALLNVAAQWNDWMASMGIFNGTTHRQYRWGKHKILNICFFLHVFGQGNNSRFFLTALPEIFVFRVSQMYSWHWLQTRVMTSPALTKVGPGFDFCLQGVARQHFSLSVCEYWLSWTNTEGKVQITLLILRMGALSRSGY